MSKTASTYLFFSSYSYYDYEILKKSIIKIENLPTREKRNIHHKNNK